MQFEHRASTGWGLALSAAVHAGLWCVFVLAGDPPPAPQGGQRAVMDVAMIAATPARAAMGMDGPPQPVLELALPPLPSVPVEPIREEIRYYFPHELERQLMVKRDRSGETELVLPHRVSMLLLVDADGRVASISFEDEIPSPELQRALREVFMALEFIPATRNSIPVPARLKLSIASNPHAAPRR